MINPQKAKLKKLSKDFIIPKSEASIL